MILTLGITRIIEQESIDISIWGSADGTDWGAKPMVAFPQKFYCGLYSILLNLAANAETRYLRVQWKMTRWGKLGSAPLFAFYVDVEESGSRIHTAVA